MTKAKSAALAAQLAQSNASLQAPIGLAGFQAHAVIPSSSHQVVSPRAYANIQAADINALPWDFFTEDFIEATTFFEADDDILDDAQFDQVMSVMGPSFDPRSISDAALPNTVSPGDYLMN